MFISRQNRIYRKNKQPNTKKNYTLFLCFSILILALFFFSIKTNHKLFENYAQIANLIYFFLLLGECQNGTATL